MTAASAIYPSLAGKVAFVTGGGSGIGASIVQAFARQKAHVGFVDVDEQASRQVMASIAGSGAKCHFELCDVRDIAALRRAIDKTRAALGPVTLLVNNAARDDRHVTEEVTPEYWDERMAVNIKHQFFASQAVLPDMKAAGGGSIVNFGSASWMMGRGGMVAYTAAKSAVLGLTRSLARDFGSVQHPRQRHCAGMDHHRAAAQAVARRRRTQATDGWAVPQARAVRRGRRARCHVPFVR